MIHIIPGSTGEDKTKKLINLANEALKTTKGNIVYIDFDNSHMYRLRHEIRYISISEFPIHNYYEFIGFICGILSEDRDVSQIYVDGLLKLAHLESVKNSEDLINQVLEICKKFEIDVIASINCTKEELPQSLIEYAS